MLAERVPAVKRLRRPLVQPLHLEVEQVLLLFVEHAAGGHGLVLLVVGAFEHHATQRRPQRQHNQLLDGRAALQLHRLYAEALALADPEGFM